MPLVKEDYNTASMVWTKSITVHSTESSLASNKNAGTNQRKWNRKPRACNSFPLVFLALKQPQRCHACDDLTDEASWPQWGQILFKSATM